jgi:hypothetical protein
LLEPVTVCPDEFEDAAAEFARSVQIVSRLPGPARGVLVEQERRADLFK